MITIKNKLAIAKMETAGRLLSQIFEELIDIIVPGISTATIDAWIEQRISELGMISMMKGYNGYRHVSCISLNDEIVHGVPKRSRLIANGDVVKVDVCVSWKGYGADMARCFPVGSISRDALDLIAVAQEALDAGIEQACVGNRVSDISAAIQKTVERHDYGVIRVFAGHGIGKRMHEDPEILNYGRPGEGAVLRHGMTLALEPMIAQKSYDVRVDSDGWTARTADGGLAAHVEDTVLVTDRGPQILTRPHSRGAKVR
ncbi:type I methionyl aminopeptidase [Candidatus Babeliales bacterium]|nr:type I methionyl aminopeptidase [Candidatus Babeliales bacterium]